MLRRVFYMVFLYFLIVFTAADSGISEDLIAELYEKYKEAKDDPAPSSLRRVFKGNEEYNIHVQKLKDVNGFKKHNLEIKHISRDGSQAKVFYINNPLESQIPNAFLSLEEFKNALSKADSKSTTAKVIITRNTDVNYSPSKLIRTIKLGILSTNQFRNRPVTRNRNIVTRKVSTRKINIKRLILKNKQPRVYLKSTLKFKHVRDGSRNVNVTYFPKVDLKTMPKLNTNKQTLLTNRNISANVTEAYLRSNVEVHEKKSNKVMTTISVSSIEISTSTDNIATSTDKSPSYISPASNAAESKPETTADLSTTASKLTEETTESNPVTETTVAEEPDDTTRRTSLSRPLVYMGSK